MSIGTKRAGHCDPFAGQDKTPFPCDDRKSDYASANGDDDAHRHGRPSPFDPSNGELVHSLLREELAIRREPRLSTPTTCVGQRSAGQITGISSRESKVAKSLFTGCSILVRKTFDPEPEWPHGGLRRVNLRKLR
jgi:hypothetical protein